VICITKMSIHLVTPNINSLLIVFGVVIRGLVVFLITEKYKKGVKSERY